MITEAQILKAIHPVVDPEMLFSVVDMGLIYGIKVLDEGKKVIVTMTLTSPMCPVGPEIVASVKAATAMIEGVETADIELVWEPPWDPATMASDDVKDSLGIW